MKDNKQTIAKQVILAGHGEVQISSQFQACKYYHRNDKMNLRHLLNGKSRLRLPKQELNKYLRSNQMAPCSIVNEKDLQTPEGRWFSAAASVHFPLIIVF